MTITTVFVLNATPGAPGRTASASGTWTHEGRPARLNWQGDLAWLRGLLRADETWPESVTGEEFRYLPQYFDLGSVQTFTSGEGTWVREEL